MNEKLRSALGFAMKAGKVKSGEVAAEAALRGGFSAAGIGPASADARCRHRLSCFSDLLKAVSLEE